MAGGQCPAFDVNSVCAGFVFALDVAQSMMLAAPEQFRQRAGHRRGRLLQDSQLGRSPDLRLLRRRCRGGAPVAYDRGRAGACTSAWAATVAGSRYIQVPAGGTRMPVDSEVLEKRLNTFTMDGPKVWDFAVDTVPRAIRSLLADHGLAPADLDLLVLHQSNLRMIEAIIKSLELSMDRTVTTLEAYGNTAAASIPITLQKAWEMGRLRPDRALCFVDSAAVCPGEPPCSTGKGREGGTMTQTGLVLQGGGALARTNWAFSSALYEEPSFQPSVVSGVSIGAITAATLVGARGDPIETLEALWRRFTVPSSPLVPEGAQRFLRCSETPRSFECAPITSMAPFGRAFTIPRPCARRFLSSSTSRSSSAALSSCS